MPFNLNAVFIKHERRLRLVFSDDLAAGAFGAPAPSAYVVTSLDSLGPSPSVSAALLVPDSMSCVELALGNNLVRGGLYRVSAIGIPAAAGGASYSESVMEFRYGLTAPLSNVEPIQRNREALLYGTDLIWNGEDYQEGPNGDLERVSGTANVTKALYRGLESNGLPWDMTYGAHVREFVDSPSPSAGTLKGSVQAQILRDPRVAKLKVDVQTDDSTTYLVITPTLISGEALKPVTMVVPQD